ncbi:MAG: hypothetical protein PWR11_918 [Bacillota bacterium]|jgi:hypothetical protein|nr:hypothetical protein [Bacillota bacterium]MDK2785052.1 hypothetical protein [Bacillota bacterium]
MLVGERKATVLEAVQGEVAALRPAYRDGAGDGTEIILRSGERLWEPKRIKAVRTELAHLYGVDLVAVRRRYGAYLERVSSVPLPFAPRLILVPLRLRLPRCRGDASQGYISYHEIKEVRAAASPPFRSLVILSSGVEVPVLSSRRVVLQHLSAAHLVEERYLNQNGWRPPAKDRSWTEYLSALVHELRAHYPV